MKPYYNKFNNPSTQAFVTFDGETTDIPILANKFEMLKSKGWRKVKSENGFFKVNIYSCNGISLFGTVYDRKVSVKGGGSKFMLASAEALKKFIKNKFNVDL